MMGFKTVSTHDGLLSRNRVLTNRVAKVSTLNKKQPALSRRNAIPGVVYNTGILPQAMQGGGGKECGCHGGKQGK